MSYCALLEEDFISKYRTFKWHTLFFQIAVESPLTEVENETFSDSLQNLPKQNLLGVNIQINIQPASIVEDDSNRGSVVQQVYKIVVSQCVVFLVMLLWFWN